MRDGRGARRAMRFCAAGEERRGVERTTTDRRGGRISTVLDKFSAIGSFDADSPSAPPSSCVQIEGFRESCDIPS